MYSPLGAIVTQQVPPTGSSEESKQIDLWQRYIAWERSNPLRVEDPALVTKRVMFAYEQVGHLKQGN